MRQGRLPGQLIIQLTDRCNATCPQCGMNINERFPRRRLSTDDVKRMIDAAGAQGVEAISFTGGEPLMVLKDLVALIHHAGAAGIKYIRTGTNGFLFRSPGKPDFSDRVHRLAETLAATPLRNFWISIDSADPQTHESMRGFPGVIRGIERALPIFQAYGLYPSANLGINRNLSGKQGIPVLRHSPGDAMEMAAADFRERLVSGFTNFFRFAADLGFSIANVCYPMSIETQPGDDLDAVYAATATSSIVSFSVQEKALLFDALGQAVLKSRSRLRIFSPLCAIASLKGQFSEGKYGPACHGGRDFFFVDAVKGHTYPCGYRGGEDLGPFWQRAELPDNSPDCHACEWECFRDPSELGGPLLALATRPFKCLRRWAHDAELTQAWLKDLLYYRDCDYFNGRLPMRPSRLQRYARPGSARN